MAVAADSHRDFLIPEQYRLAVRPTTNDKALDGLCLFFCRTFIVAQVTVNVKEHAKNTRRRKNISLVRC